jgi:hypothetical protein
MKNITWKREQKYFASLNSSFPLLVPPACYQVTVLVGLPESYGGRIRSFSLSTSFHRSLSWSYITIGPLVAAGQRRSLTRLSP